jgi:hypothetical protein
MAKAGAGVLAVATMLALMGAARFGLGSRVDEPDRHDCAIEGRVISIASAEAT